MEMLAPFSSVNDYARHPEKICKLTKADLHERISIMLEQEASSLPLKNYIETIQHDGMKEIWRRKVTCWLLEFQEEFHISQDTVAVAVNYMDRYLSEISTKKSILQLLAMGAVFIAAKLLETFPIGMTELQTLAEGMYLESDIKLMELELLRVIQWRLNPVTPQCVMNHLILYEESADQRRLLREHAEAFLDVALCEYEFLQFLPSTQGIAAILCAFETTKLNAANWVSQVRQYEIVGSPRTLQCKAKMQEVFYNSFPDIARAHADSPTGVDELLAAEGADWSQLLNQKPTQPPGAASPPGIPAGEDSKAEPRRNSINSPVTFYEATRAPGDTSCATRPVPMYHTVDNRSAQSPPEPSSSTLRGRASTR